MTERSYFWSGNTVGDAIVAPYTIDVIHEIFHWFFCSRLSSEGIIKGYGNELQLTHTGSLNISIATGAAIVYGRFYENDAAVASTVSAPGSGFNYYTYVLRLTGDTTQTIRIVRLGPSTVDYPTVTQLVPDFPNPPSSWEIEIARVRVSNTSVVVVADRRSYWRNNGYQLPVHLAYQNGAVSSEFDNLYIEHGDIAITPLSSPDDRGRGSYIPTADADFYLEDDLYAPLIKLATPITNNPNILATMSQYFTELGVINWVDWTGANHASNTIGYLLFGYGLL